ncbi:hypothetical protein BJX99DRAFT_231588 [Aspergillus californicus]
MFPDPELYLWHVAPLIAGSLILFHHLAEMPKRMVTPFSFPSILGNEALGLSSNRFLYHTMDLLVLLGYGWYQWMDFTS